MTDKKTEYVMAVKSALLAPLVPEGFSRASRLPPGVLLRTLLTNQEFLEREQAEQMTDNRQIIPYVLVRYAGQYLMMQRTKKQGEKRLWGKFSLGVGGHIDQETPLGGYRSIIWASAYRELDEEIKLPVVPELQFVGTLRDDSSPVGRVHLGLVHLADLESDVFTVGEPDLMTAQWMTVAGLEGYHERMEGWSQILRGAIVEGLIA